METTVDQAISGVCGQGRIRLAPAPSSTDERIIAVEIDLHHDPERLALGDLRRCAEKNESLGRHEEALRLWSVLEQAATRARRGPLAATAARRAVAVERRLGLGLERRDVSPAKSIVDRVTTKYDYDALAADIDDGMTKVQVARKWGSSPSTVQRAVEYVTIRDEILDESPEIKDQIMAGHDLAEIARRYDVPLKVLKWMVNTRFERRAAG